MCCVTEEKEGWKSSLVDNVGNYEASIRNKQGPGFEKKNFFPSEMSVELADETNRHVQRHPRDSDRRKILL